MPTSILIAVLSVALPPQLPAPTGGLQPVATAARETSLTHCLVSLIEDVQVPAREAGALTGVAVVEGEYVTQGHLLAQIDDRQPRLDKLAAELQRDAALAKA
jgi:multidrug efflux pump subunit AcrA (membrane-fusion protein)